MLRVLVAEGHVDTAAVLVDMLNSWGHDAAEAYDSASALAMAAEFLPEVVLVDIGLPGIGGYEAARRLRSIPGLRGAVLIALMGPGEALHQQRAIDAGFDVFLLKPVGPDEFFQLLGCCEQALPERLRLRDVTVHRPQAGSQRPHRPPSGEKYSAGPSSRGTTPE